MAQEPNMEKARGVYYSIISHLNHINWKFDRFDDKLMIKSGVSGNDIPITFIVRVAAKNEVVQFISSLPFNMPEDKRVDGAIAVCAANYGLVDGSFDYDISDGAILFRLTCSYRGSNLSGDLIDYIIFVSSATVDGYNDRFQALANGDISLTDFLEEENAD